MSIILFIFDLIKNLKAMSKDVLFRVELSFKDKIVSDEELREISENIANAIESQIKHGEVGMSPRDSDNFTTEVRVTPWYLNKTVIKSF